ASLGIKNMPIVGIVPNSAAAKAGLQIGDVITHVDKQSIRDMQHLKEVIGNYQAGDHAELTVQRTLRNKSETLKLKVNFDSWGDRDPTALQSLQGGTTIIHNVIVPPPAAARPALQPVLPKQAKESGR
ncbi:MAG: PDZ domain-containing protein, partial [Planctomycetales bacterium]|nr:PDZ domain-containing protein [Planctomycetales bacterium]